MEGIWRSAYKNLLDDLNRQGHLQLTINDISQDYVTVIDGESCLMRKGLIFDSFPQDTRTYHYVSCHKMYMIGVVSNVPDAERSEDLIIIPSNVQIDVYFRKIKINFSQN